MKTFSVTLRGFKTKDAALRFLQWYEGAGEQQFYEHLDIRGEPKDEGCTVDVANQDSSGFFFDETDEGFVAKLK